LLGFIDGLLEGVLLGFKEGLLLLLITGGRLVGFSAGAVVVSTGTTGFGAGAVNVGSGATGFCT
jgi:hypothetical protein